MTLKLPDKYESGFFENESDKRIYIAASSLLKEIGMTPDANAYYYILEAAAIMTQKAKKRLLAFEIFNDIGYYYGKSSYTVERSIKSAIDKAWKTGNSEIHEKFEHNSRASGGSPTAMQFLRIFVDCIMTNDKRPEKNNDFIRIAFGQMLLNLDINKYRLKDIKVMLQTIEGNTQIYDYETAREAYPEFEAGFVQLIIDGIAIPRQCEELSVSDLNYSDSVLGKKIANELYFDNIHHIKDFRKYEIYNLRDYDVLNKKYIDEFDEALIRTIINELHLKFQPVEHVAIKMGLRTGV
jgi:hypothetical protein